MIYVRLIEFRQPCLPGSTAWCQILRMKQDKSGNRYNNKCNRSYTWQGVLSIGVAWKISRGSKCSIADKNYKIWTFPYQKSFSHWAPLKKMHTFCNARTTAPPCPPVATPLVLSCTFYALSWLGLWHIPKTPVMRAGCVPRTTILGYGIPQDCLS